MPGPYSSDRRAGSDGPPFSDSHPSEPERLFLRCWPVVSIVSVTIDGAETLDTAHYRFDPEIGVVYRLTESGYPRRWWCRKSIAIEYVAGYLLPADDGRDLPASLEAACIDLVASYWASRGRDPALAASAVRARRRAPRLPTSRVARSVDRPSRWPPRRRCAAP